MAFLIPVSGFVLPEAFPRILTGHPYIQALQYPIELWVSSSETGVLCEDTLR